MGVAVAVGTGVKVGGMGEGVVVGVDVGGAKTAVQDVSSTRIMQTVKRKIVGMGCWRIGAILPSDFRKLLIWPRLKKFGTRIEQITRANTDFL